MKITATQDYALRIVSHLTDRDDEYVRTSEISKTIGVSRAYITQLTVKLKQAGIIESLQGKEGGYRLKDGQEPTAAEVLGALEPEEDSRLPTPYDPSPERLAVEAAIKAALDMTLPDLIVKQQPNPSARAQ